jgi:hypothetical protein
MIGSMMICTSVVVLLVGMLAGIAMGIEQNFVPAPAHAHLNLIGGVPLFLFGLYPHRHASSAMQDAFHVSGELLVGKPIVEAAA